MLHYRLLTITMSSIHKRLQRDRKLFNLPGKNLTRIQASSGVNE